MTGLGLIELDKLDSELLLRSKSSQPYLSEKPKIELYVMAYDPYSLQSEKGIIPVLNLLKDKLDIKIKFADYSMNGKEEINEQSLQYCIQNEENDKFIRYLECFVQEGGSEKCLISSEVDKFKLEVCTKNVEKKYRVIENYNDKSTWIGSSCPEGPYCYPTFDINKEDIDNYEISEFPLLIINGRWKIIPKDSESLKELICNSFSKNNMPEECSAELNSHLPSLGFGIINKG
jgi:hypothetical protein